MRARTGATGRTSSMRALVVTADGEEWMIARGARPRVPALGARAGRGRRARRVPARATAARRDQGDRRRARRTAKGDTADEQAHVRKRLQEPVGRARGGEDARALRAQGPPNRRRDDLAEARELHRERRRCDERGLRRADGRGSSSSTRGVRRRARARGRLRRCPRAASRSRRKRQRGAESSRMVGGRSARGSRRHVAAASVVVPFPRGAAGARLDLVRFVPSGRSLLVTFGASSR